MSAACVWVMHGKRNRLSLSSISTTPSNHRPLGMYQNIMIVTETTRSRRHHSSQREHVNIFETSNKPKPDEFFERKDFAHLHKKRTTNSQTCFEIHCWDRSEALVPGSLSCQYIKPFK